MPPRKNTIVPSDAELAILRVFWKRGPATAKEIHDELNAGRDAQRVVTTTAKFLQIMLKKELVTRDDSTWRHTYQARIARRTVPLTEEQRRDLFEIVEDRYDRKSTLIVAQLPTQHWHQLIGDPTLADALLDRLIHNAYSITRKGESMRKKKDVNLTTDQPSAMNS